MDDDTTLATPSPDDVGAVVATLARGDIPYATGQVLTIDGGLMVPRL